MSADNLSRSRLPQPVLLVVGDALSDFSSEVWDGVVEAATEEHGRPVEITSESLEPLLGATRTKLQGPLRRLGASWAQRPATRQPIPLQLSHSHLPDPRVLRGHLSRILDLFDVWAIVASASAGDVKPLREALEGIDVPLLVTTDSTTVSASAHRSNELRLMPSNHSQATAILFTAIRENQGVAHEEAPLRPLPAIACSYETTPQAREYVRDLQRQLNNAAALYDVSIAEFKPKPDHGGPLIVIGYSGHAETIVRERVENRLTILSDGCATTSVRRVVRDERTEDADYWYVARPEVELHEVGRTCFSAVAEAGRRLLIWDPRNASEEILPRMSLRDVIKEILVESSGDLFSFDGIENVAPAYRVEPVLRQTEPETTAPPGSTSIDGASRQKKHLRAVKD